MNTQNATRPKRLIVGVSGASGIIYAVRLLECLREIHVETHLVVSRAAEITRAHEMEISRAEFHALATVSHPIGDMTASISSGSFHTLGMVIAPCSVRSLAEATRVTTTILTRAADVVLKERRRLILLLRETPFSLIHIRNMQLATEAGAIVMPPVPAFYAKPRSIEDMVMHTVFRVLDMFDLEPGRLKRWGEELTIGRSYVASDVHQDLSHVNEEVDQ